MKKFSAFVLGLVCFATAANAQSKVFKEVNDEISSTFKAIKQDDALVGYLAFTQLERANEDSFNYKITIMDENLNDIGKVNFRNEQLDLHSVSFDQDVLCLGYFKSAVKMKQNAKGKTSKRAGTIKYAVVTQFLNLEGKILKTNNYPVDIKYDENNVNLISTYQAYNPNYGKLKHSIQVKNVPQKGFACFFGDEKTNSLIVFNTKGDQLWKKKITEAENGFIMMTANNAIYLLSKDKVTSSPEGGYAIQGFSASDSVSFEKIALKDKQGNYLKVINFANDPVSGKAYLAGNIINPKMGEKFYKARHIAKGAYTGVFTINLEGTKKSDIKEVYSYWGDGSMNPTITNKGYYTDNHFYSKYYETIRDFQGNTYFVGSSFIKRPKIGAIASSVILSPLVFFSPMILGIGGTSKCKITDATLLKQTPSGKVTVESSIACNNSNFFPSKMPLAMFDKRSFYTVNNNDTKTNYLIVDDVKDIVIYNVTQKKIARTVHHKDGQTQTNIFPAKEGHIMVAEVNRKEKYSKLSIESL